jgi:N-acetyl-anhydromuramyl-L-alanine amidase AmpD
MSDRIYPAVHVRRWSPNKSTRTTGIRLIVLHSTEGNNVPGDGDLIGLGGWFANPAAQVSSHVATDADGHSARYVRDRDKAWHCAAYNSPALGIEQVGRAAQTSWSDAQLRETARWIAVWSRYYSIPITHSTTAGVCTHSDLGAAGGGHHDPGTDYPLDKVLKYAADYRKKQIAAKRKKAAS